MVSMIYAVPNHGTKMPLALYGSCGHVQENNPILYSTQMLQESLFAEETQGKDPKPGTLSDL